jgi:CDP-diacylglycerol---serine O-phosphatidyltransferase
MSRLRKNRARNRFLKQAKKRPVKYITVLPSLVTILNGVCGFAAIVFASSDDPVGSKEISPYTIAAYLVFIAMIADMLDGRLARMSQTTSSFGGQLDSLCDVISFGVAPAFVMLRLLASKLSAAQITNDSFIVRFIWLSALAYVTCAVIRLARFNVENVESESDHMRFTGLPSPAAAGAVMSLIMLHQETLPGFRIILVVLPFVALGVAVLMVSRVQYEHVLNYYLKGKKPFGYLIKTLLALGLVIVVKLPAALALCFCAFVLSSLIQTVYHRLAVRKGMAQVHSQENAKPEHLAEQPPC